jgi:hypothetical protein
MTRICKSAHCSVEFEPNGKQLYCSQPCRAKSDSETRLIRHSEQREAAPPILRACLECQAEYTPAKSNQKYCNPRCSVAAQRARDLLKYGTKIPRTGRTCKDCSIDIDDLFLQALRCAPCGKKHKNSWRRKTDSVLVRANKLATSKDVTLKRRDAPRLSAPKVKVNPEMPNYGGDWYPGWDGPWCPSVGAEGGALIEKHLKLGPAPTSDPRQKKQIEETAA